MMPQPNCGNRLAAASSRFPDPHDSSGIAMSKTKVLLIEAGNPLQPASGMDVCAAAHLRQIAADPRIDLTAIAAHHATVPGGVAVSADGRARVFPADLAATGGTGSRLAIKLPFVASGGLLAYVGFRSGPARSAIAEALRKSPDVVVIDHLGSLSNLSLSRLAGLRLRGRTRIVFIAHDVAAHLVRESVAFRKGWLRKAFGRVHAVQIAVWERLVCTLAHRVIFISDYDRRQFPGLPDAKAIALCPVIEPEAGNTDTTGDEAGGGRFVVFIGSPAFMPNDHAIRWIVNDFAPELRKQGSDLKILLVGKGTEQIDTTDVPNVRGLGFVADERLHRLLRSSCGLLSPIIHGSGLKIKVLEAIAAGCPVLATEQSLRGYGFMNLRPLIEIQRPAETARAIDELLKDKLHVEDMRSHVAQQWKAYKHDSSGRFGQIMIDLLQ